MKIAFFSMIDDNYYHGCRTDEFIESFKRFHPDIDLIIFRQEALNRIFANSPGVSFLNCKSTFARQLYDHYDLLVNLDTDHLVFGRMSEVLEGDYDVCAPACLNNYVQMGLNFIRPGYPEIQFVTREAYLEAGMIGGYKYFWDNMHHCDLNWSLKFPSKDMDCFNAMVQFHPFKIKRPQGHFDPYHPNYTCWYGCSLMGREHDVRITNDQIMLYSKPMRNYHFGKFINPKTHPTELFSKEICDWIYSKVVVGNTPTPTKIEEGIYYY